MTAPTTSVPQGRSRVEEPGVPAGRRASACARQVRRVVATEVRTSPALLPIAALTVIGCLRLASADAQWVGYWQNTTLKVHTYACIVIGIVSGAIAAWQAGRSRAAGLHPMENTATVDGASIVLRAVAPIWLLATTGFLLVLAAALGRSAVVHAGTPPWGLVVMTVAVLGMQVAAGAALGAWLPRRSAPVVTIVVLYAGGAAPVYVEGGERTWGRLYPIVQQLWDPLMREAPARLLTASAWLMCVAVLLVLVAGRRWAGVRPSLTSLAAAATLAAVSAGFVLVPQVAPGEQFASVRGAGDPVACTNGSGPTFCVWADHADTLPSVAGAASAFARATDGLTFIPTTLAEPGVARALGRPAVDVGAFTAPVPSREEALAALVTASAPQPGPTCIGADGAVIGGSDAARAIPAILSERLGIPPVFGADSAAYPRLEQLTVARQNAWMNAAAEAEVHCAEPPPVPAS